MFRIVALSLILAANVFAGQQLILQSTFHLQVTGSVQTGQLVQVWGRSPNLAVQGATSAATFRTQVFGCGKIQADGMRVTTENGVINLVPSIGGGFSSPTGELVTLNSVEFTLSGLANPPTSQFGYRCTIQVFIE